MSTRSNALRRGFTLIEVLLALGLTSVILGMVFTISARATSIWEARQKATFSSRAAWSFIGRLARDLRNAVGPERYGDEARLAGGDAGSTLYRSLPEDTVAPETASDLAAIEIDDDAIRFATLPGGATGLPYIVEFRVKRSPTEGASGIVRRQAPFGEDVSGSAETLVARDVVSLNLEYLLDTGAWVGEWSDRNNLPRAVRIHVAAIAPSEGSIPELVRFSTVVHLPVGTRIRP